MQTQRAAQTIALAVLFSAALLARPAHANKPINLSLFAPVQLFSENEPISGFRFNLIYGRTRSMKGLDLGLVNHIIAGPFDGVQLGLVNVAQRSLSGWQHGGVGIVRGQLKGVQTGVVNVAQRVRGVQFGAVNITDTIYGIQIGLVNVIKRGGWLPVMVLVNGSL
ncbi:MAG: hypothetical protein H6707_20850 [Deltaproteobacteria bacterium]|nr:hypothetical protein [Deltaproteobacteria bacterium]